MVDRRGDERMPILDILPTISHCFWLNYDQKNKPMVDNAEEGRASAARLNFRDQMP
jgi:hypothetical protein